MEKTILFVDNNQEQLDVYTQLLEFSDYRVIPAPSVAKAETFLEQHHIHLAILDVRLEDDDDPNDISGLTLAKNEQYRYLPKIILTSYPSWQYAEIALGATLEGLQVVKMVAKASGTERILEAVEEAFATQVPLNWALKIRKDENRIPSMAYLTSLLVPESESDQLGTYTAEFEGLLRRLFAEHEELYIERVITSHLEGRIFLHVSAFTPRKKEQQYLVVCGKRDILTKAIDSSEESTPIGSPYFPALKQRANTTHFAAIFCDLPNADGLGDVKTYLRFLRYCTVTEAVRVTNGLFKEILYPWYQENRYWQTTGDLSPLFNRWFQASPEATIEQLGTVGRLICEQALSLGLVFINYADDWLNLQISREEKVLLPNPLLALLSMTTKAPVLFGTAHGNLVGTAVLTDGDSKCWLTDFAHINEGPLVQDFASFEAAIKFDVWQTTDFFERYKLDESLLASSELDQPPMLDAFSSDMAKIAQTIFTIREWAAKLDIRKRHYHIGLLYQMLYRLCRFDTNIRYTRRELAPYLHALVSAALLYQKLIPAQPDLPSHALNRLWVDEEKQQVWVRGQLKELTPQEYDLLLYLYHRAGENCSREMIMKDVFDIEYDEDWTPKQIKDYSDPRINSAINRLRKKIEVDPRKPEFIMSAWGKGYRLELAGKQ